MTDIMTELTVEQVLADAVANGVTPGAVAAVFDAHQTLRVWCAGSPSWYTPAPTTADTIYDLASLTKLLGTTVIAAVAMADHGVDDNEQPNPQWPGVTVKHLLQHSAGLPAHVRLWEQLSSSGSPSQHVHEALLLAASVAPIHPPGEKTIYSDIGMIVLGAWLEQRLGQRLDVLLHTIAAAHAPTLRYVRLSAHGYHPQLELVAPTERCPWRRRMVHGQVHDENAFVLDGVAGHAGLFGSLVDVVQMSQWLLRCIIGEDTTPVGLRLARFARTPGERPMGFDRTTEGGSTGGVMSADTVGHLGFTGTSMWLDPVARRGYVLLTNRVHESRDNDAGIRALRIAFHRAAHARGYSMF
jgi:serine-type D-Ala-D-Ala carboxypeptidase